GLTDGLGFGDYQPDETVPPVEVSLANPRASSGEPAAIAVGRKPGSEWVYSGGGYLILELLVEEVSGESFEAFTRHAILEPLGMTRSGYRYLGEMNNSAGSHDARGQSATVYRYACKAATAFSTSAHDLTRFVLAQLPGAADKPLRQTTIDAMREPQASVMGLDIWGLGTILYAATASGDHVFGHDGVNEPAINSTARVNLDTGDAIIVLETGDPSLATVLGFHWVFWQTGRPDFIGLPGELRRVVPVLLGGALGILVLGGVLTRRARQARSAG
ncbi:MAG: serine hydrolase domain-containing protein, partial [Rhodanobacteraceae bacterium]